MRPVVKAKKTTREIVAVYPSVLAAAKANGRQSRRLSNALEGRKLGAGECYYRYADEFDPNESFAHVRQYRPVLAVNEKTGHWMWFESAKAASRELNCSKDYVRGAVKHGRRWGGYAFVYADRRMRAEKCEVKA